MEGFLVVLVVSAGIVEGIHEIVLIIKMNLEQVLPPISTTAFVNSASVFPNLFFTFLSSPTTELSSYVSV
jgi:hypothetical protein